MILVDAQLPPSIAAWLRRCGVLSEHVGGIMGDPAATDAAIWARAQQPGWAIITKDQDFVDRGLVHGPPPVVIHLVLGNCANRRLLTHLEQCWPLVAGLLAQPDTAVITVDWLAVGVHAMPLRRDPSSRSGASTVDQPSRSNP